MKLTETTINYLKSQLQDIDTFNRYAPTIVIHNGADATKTKHISLNSESAPLLIIWLATRFTPILPAVCVAICDFEEMNEDTEWSITQRSNRFNELTELFSSRTTATNQQEDED